MFETLVVEYNFRKHFLSPVYGILLVLQKCNTFFAFRPVRERLDSLASGRSYPLSSHRYQMCMR